MSGSRQRGTVSRVYRARPDVCARALALLLEKSVTKKAAEHAVELDGRDGTTVEEATADVSIISS